MDDGLSISSMRFCNSLPERLVSGSATWAKVEWIVTISKER